MKELDRYIPLRSSKDKQYGCLFNMSRHTVTIGDVVYPTLEHAFQLSRFVPDVQDLGNLSSGLAHMKDKMDSMNSLQAKKFVKDTVKSKFVRFIDDMSDEDYKNMEYLTYVKLCQHEIIQQKLYILNKTECYIYEDVSDRAKFTDSSLFWGAVMMPFGLVGKNALGEIWNQHASVCDDSTSEWYFKGLAHF